MMRNHSRPLSSSNMYFRPDRTQRHAPAAPCMGLAIKVGDVGVFKTSSESFCLAAALRYLFTGAWLSERSCPLEYLLDTVMRHEW